MSEAERFQVLVNRETGRATILRREVNHGQERWSYWDAAPNEEDALRIIREGGPLVDPDGVPYLRWAPGNHIVEVVR